MRMMGTVVTTVMDSRSVSGVAWRLDIFRASSVLVTRMELAWSSMSFRCICRVHRCRLL